jgi:hypothetical protein
MQSPVFGDDTLRLIGSYCRQKDNGPAEKVLADSFLQPAELLFDARPSLDERSLKSTFGGTKGGGGERFDHRCRHHAPARLEAQWQAETDRLIRQLDPAQQQMPRCAIGSRPAVRATA